MRNSRLNVSLAWRAVVQPQETTQKRLLRLGEQAHVHGALAPAQNRAKCDRQNLMKIVERGVARARILQPLPTGDEIFQYDLPERESFTTR
jgi:hypothetical protein